MMMRDDKLEARRRTRSRDRNGNTDQSNTALQSEAATIKTGHRQQQQHHQLHPRMNNVVDGEKSSRSRSSMERGKKNNNLMRDRNAPPPSSRKRHEYDTPFDKSGRCHYHVNIQLATKKFSGGWHIIFQVCPKCMEQRSYSSRNNKTMPMKKKDSTGGDSTHFARSSSKGMGGGEFDDNGCCIVHSHIQVATKKLLGGGWKVTGVCPICNGGSGLLDDDSHSAKSGKSNLSDNTRKSTRSMNTTATTTTTTAKSLRASSGKAAQSGRYGALPFDSDGYCCKHPSVQIAQRKLMGGFKTIHDVCPECAKVVRSGGGGSSSSVANYVRRSSSSNASYVRRSSRDGDRGANATRSRSKSCSGRRSRSPRQRRQSQDGGNLRQQNRSSAPKLKRRVPIASEMASSFRM